MTTKTESAKQSNQDNPAPALLAIFVLAVVLAPFTAGLSFVYPVFHLVMACFKPQMYTK